jgi:hypothetical protein
MIVTLIACIAACSFVREIPATYIVLVTQVVPVTQIVPITQIVESPSPFLFPTARASTPSEIMPTPNNGLLVWYDFEGDFPSSGKVLDRSGNGHDAEVVGTVYISEGISGGQAILFDGNSYLLSQGNPAATRNIISFSLWFKTDHPENNYKLASAAWWSGGPGSGWILATHIPEFWSDDTKSLYLPEIINNDNHFPAGVWIHEAVTYDGQDIREYTNGQLVNDWPTTGAAIGQGQPMVVGAWPPFSAYNFQGSIDELQLVGRALSPQEVQEIWNRGR